MSLWLNVSKFKVNKIAFDSILIKVSICLTYRSFYFLSARFGGELYHLFLLANHKVGVSEINIENQ